MVIVIIKPLVKNKFGSKNDSNNYREVMQSSTLFKVLEYLILPELMTKCKVSTRQFGYLEKKLLA